MTRRLYYEDCHLQTFRATVLSCTQTQAGYAVTLDATAFYPEGGGQACDLGRLGGASVLDVRSRGEQILHLCDSALAVGESVEGTIDWERRFDLMQQHTGEHILSGLVHRRFGYHNVGFHVGTQLVTIDFDGPIDADALAEIELAANKALWEDLPVECFYPSQDELATLSYRSKKALQYPVRIVKIGTYDTCACCGVHTAHTGEVGLIKLISCVKFHEGVRIELACGARALAYCNAVCGQNRSISRLLSAKMLETFPAVQALSDAYTAEKYRAGALQNRILDAIAETYRQAHNVVHFEAALNAQAVRSLAEKISAGCTGFAAVLSGSDEAGYSICLASTQDAAQLGSALCAACNGRGGGRDGFFQGSVQAPAQQIMEFFSGQR